MSVSQNGWGVIENPDSPLLRPWVLGPVTLSGRTGPPGFVLAHFALYFHEEIERLYAPDMPVPGTPTDDHFYGLRRIGGTDVWSNHASGTAIDLNALRHPQGTDPEETYTDLQCRRIRAKMSDKYAPVLKWGGDFNTTPDSMHFELQPLKTASKNVVRTLALELVSTPVGKRLIAAQVRPVKWENW